MPSLMLIVLVWVAGGQSLARGQRKIQCFGLAFPCTRSLYQIGCKAIVFYSRTAAASAWSASGCCTLGTLYAGVASTL